MKESIVGRQDRSPKVGLFGVSRISSYQIECLLEQVVVVRHVVHDFQAQLLDGRFDFAVDHSARHVAEMKYCNAAILSLNRPRSKERLFFRLSI